MTAPRSLAVLAALVAVACWLAPPATPVVQAQPQRAPVKWEYLTVLVHPTGSVTVRGTGLAARGPDWKSVAEQYKLAAESVDEEHRYRVLNHIGSNGWELVTHAATPSGAGALERYTFKRPAP